MKYLINTLNILGFHRDNMEKREDQSDLKLGFWDLDRNLQKCINKLTVRSYANKLI